MEQAARVRIEMEQKKARSVRKMIWNNARRNGSHHLAAKERADQNS
jgi:hypothetical protein